MILEKTENESGKTGISKRRKMLVSILVVVFIVVLLGAFWDLYGRKMFCSCDCSSQQSAQGSGSQAAASAGGKSAVSGDQAASVGGQKGNKQGGKTGTTQTGSASASATSATGSAAYDSCINKTTDNPQCKDCCDCLSGTDSATRTACRNTCAMHDFGTNSDFITVTSPSTLGEKGDYLTCTKEASSGECKTCCENSMGLQCGDYRFCRTACNTKFGTTSGPQQ
ncbi:MAG: hypothetical protein WCL23_02505 [Candidatus Moraniibacteriota bacterium]